METNGINKEQNNEESQSFLLGKELGKFCQTWQDDRKNLEHFVQNFNGQISRHIKTLYDVNKHYISFLERLVRNKCNYINCNDFTERFDNFNEKFDANLFIRGYLNAQYLFVKKD